uniref:Probable cytosolic iron-sulfur protein assembly protein CIAO1 homolog n=1 Tax=Trypanosoma congolense (strain IL3000) TaxID=1068625 RepID=G0URZ3_TRYCI|nr:putative WD-repeat containing protein [Trypanosoma congolense IL3000]
MKDDRPQCFDVRDSRTGGAVGGDALPVHLPYDPPPLLQLELVSELEGHTERVWCVAWCPAADILASCSGDGTVRLWGYTHPLQNENDREGGEVDGQWNCIDTLQGEHSRTIRHVSWSPSGAFIGCASFDRTASVWRRSSDDPSCYEFELEAVLDGHENEVKCVAWATDNTLATCSRDRTVWVWDRVDIGEFECAGVLAGHAQDVKSCAWFFSPTGVEKPVLLSCSYDNTIKIWTESHRRDDWYCCQTLIRHEGTVWAVAVQPLEQSIDAMQPGGEEEGEETTHRFTPIMCSSSDDKTITFWGRDTQGKFFSICTASGFAERTIYSVGWAPCGRGHSNSIVACGSGDNKITLLGLYQTMGSNEIHVNVIAEVSAAHEADVNSVAFSFVTNSLMDDDRGNDGELLLASGGDDSIVRLWRVKKMQL